MGSTALRLCGLRPSLLLVLSPSGKSFSRSPAVVSCLLYGSPWTQGSRHRCVTSPTESAWAAAQWAEWRRHAELVRLLLLTLAASPSPGAWAGPPVAAACHGVTVLGRVRTRLPRGRWKGLLPPEAWTSAVHRRSASSDPRKRQMPGPSPGWPTVFAALRSTQAPPPFLRTTPDLPPSPAQGTSSYRISSESRMSGGCLFLLFFSF